MAKIVKRTGTRCCESYVLLGNEKGHAVRSDGVQFENGERGICCVFCGTALPTVIDALINANGRRVQPVNQSSVHEHRFQFNYGDPRKGQFVHAVVSFDDPAQFDLQPEEVGRAFDADEFQSLPAPLAHIGRALSAVDFYVVAPRDLEEFHAHSLRTIIMWRGRYIVPGKPAIGGVRVVLSYIV